jgi:5'-nucleotidase
MAKIVVTNDDGITTAGITHLAAAMAELGEVVVIAPDQEMSAVSHAISLNKPLTVKELRPNWFSVDGTPTDCVYLGIKDLATDVDLVVSGINKGANLGKDVHYSGTVAGAVEGAIFGIPAISFSQISAVDDETLARAAAFAAKLAAIVLALNDGSKPLLNVNFPSCKPKGVKLTKLGERHYENTISKKMRPNGDRTFQIGGQSVHHQQDQNNDTQAAEDGYISVTPLKIDISDYKEMVEISDWDIFHE